MSKNLTENTRREHNVNNSSELYLEKESSILTNSPLKSSAIYKSSPFHDMKPINSKRAQNTETPIGDVSQNKKSEPKENYTVR